MVCARKVYDFSQPVRLISGAISCRCLLQGNVDAEEWMFLLTGGLGDGGNLPNPAPTWLADRAWKELQRLSKLPAFRVRHPEPDTELHP